MVVTFDCDTCHKQFAYCSQLKNHYKFKKKCKAKKRLPEKITLNRRNTNLFSCNRCLYRTKQPQHLTRHKQRDCPNKETNVIMDGFEFDLCGCFLKSRVNLIRHKIMKKCKAGRLYRERKQAEVELSSKILQQSVNVVTSTPILIDTFMMFNTV